MVTLVEAGAVASASSGSDISNPFKVKFCPDTGLLASPFVSVFGTPSLLVPAFSTGFALMKNPPGILVLALLFFVVKSNLTG